MIYIHVYMMYVNYIVLFAPIFMKLYNKDMMSLPCLEGQSLNLWPDWTHPKYSSFPARPLSDGSYHT